MLWFYHHLKSVAKIYFIKILFLLFSSAESPPRQFSHTKDILVKIFRNCHLLVVF